ncbi:MAG: hypothetical protein GKS07_02195 [Nitrosopumilus sp.]|nr:MAG: hypothetical protein GKS07_02195 [Nitrosopumilus sp.]
MASILLMAIGVGVATALLVSVAFQFLIPSDDSGLSPLEKDCQQIANAGYRIHSIYPDFSLDELPHDDFKRMEYLDKMWMEKCVAVLPTESIISIANNVERDVLHGE